MAGLKKKEISVLLKSLEKQGCELVPRTKGVVVRFPSGDTMIVHNSDSDHRAVMNTRARVRRNGLVWPWG